MKFNDAAEVDMICYQMRLADWSRALNRTRINELFNGFPPYSEQEEQENQIEVNVNDLASTRLAHDARSQFYGAFLKPGNYFTLRADCGAPYRRDEYSVGVTHDMNKIMKRSMPYFECYRSTFATDVLHGIGPSAWADRQSWCPKPIGIEDVLIPAKTLLTMENLPFFAIYRSLTAPELIRLTRGPKVDGGWNMALVNRCLEWVDESTLALMGTNWPEVWSPEKLSERVKGDGGFYAGDQVPTIDCWDFYYLDLDCKDPGWCRRIILDAWSTPAAAGAGVNPQKPTSLPRRKGSLYERKKGDREMFLFNPGNRKYAASLSELITFQFADLSAVAPFQYHSVRSLGFLVYAVCNIQNRLRCKFNEAVFEALMMYFKVKSMDDAERAIKLQLVNRGFIDDTLTPLTAAERYQVNTTLVELGIKENTTLIQQLSSSYVQSQNYSENNTEKTKFQVMAEVGAMNSLVSAALMQAYAYQNFQNREVARRFFNPESKDVDVMKFLAMCARRNIPQKLMNADAWEIQSEKVLGAGNKTLEMAIAEQLMQFRTLYDPESQRKILRDVTLAITDDPARAQDLVPPEKNHVSDAVMEAHHTAGDLMIGIPVPVKTGMNHIDYIETMLADMAFIIQKAQQSGGIATPAEVEGLEAIAANIDGHIEILAENPDEKPRVKEYKDKLGKMMNLVKAFLQRLQEHAKAQQGKNGDGGMDQKDAAKIQATVATAKTKQDLAKQSHAQRTAQRQIQFEQQIQQDKEKHALEMQKEAGRSVLELHGQAAKDALEIKKKKRRNMTDAEE